MSDFKEAWCPYNEDFCEKIVLEAGWVLKWLEHIKHHHGLIYGTRICPLASCGRLFESWKEFRTHIVEHPFQLYLDQGEKFHGGPVPSNNDSDMFYCPYAFACAHSSFANEDDVKKHIINVHEMVWGGWQCALCPKTFKTVPHGS